MPSATAACTITPSSNFDTQLVSISADGQTAGNGASYNPVISPDGEYVAFVSLATNLVTNITADGHTPQVYIRNTCNIATIITTAPTDACVPTTYLVSTPDGTTFGNGLSSNPSISEDGLFVSFTSAATNLGSTAPNPNALPEVFERGTCITTITSTTNTCVSVTTLISTPDGTTARRRPQRAVNALRLWQRDHHHQQCVHLHHPRQRPLCGLRVNGIEPGDWRWSNAAANLCSRYLHRRHHHRRSMHAFYYAGVNARRRHARQWLERTPQR